MNTPLTIRKGKRFPSGAIWSPDGTNFSLFSRICDGRWSCCSSTARMTPSRPASSRSIPCANRTYHYWHVFVSGRAAGAALRLSRAWASDPARGLRFDPPKVLLDPYGRGVVVPQNYSRDAAAQPGDNAATAMKSVVVDPRAYDWEGDAPLRRPVCTDHHLRNARARLYAPSQFRRQPRTSAAPMPA